MKRLILFTAVAGCLAMIYFLWIAAPRQPISEASIVRDIARARNANRAGRYEEASSLLQSVLAAAPDNQNALFVAAETETKLEHFQQAVEYYDRVSSESLAVDARTYAAEITRHVGNLLEAIRRFQQVLELDPNNELTHRRLAWLYNIHGCRHAAQDHLFQLCKRQAINLDELILLGDGERQIDFSEDLLAMAETTTQAIGLKLGMAKQEYTAGRIAAARDLLSQLPDDPEQTPKWMLAGQLSLIGRMQLDNDNLDSLVAWRNTTIENQISTPDLWLLHGEILLAMARRAEAVDCFKAAVALNPNSARAHYQLASALVIGGQEKQADKFFSRAAKLGKLQDAINLIASDANNLAAMLKASQLCEELCRPWEAIVWQAFARQQIGNSTPPDWAIEGLAKRLPQPPPESAQTLRSGCLCHLELPINKAAMFDRIRDIRIASNRDTDSLPDVHFRDVAKTIGLNFQYQTGLEPRLSGRPMYSFPGGGMGVIDLDLDSWPDLYVAQATTWPPKGTNTLLVDALYRNLRGDQCQNVVSVAGINGVEFSHGVSVGDFDNDGFPDLYVANIFQNCLYHNCGDGTFQKVHVPDFPNHGWTTSCVIADLNSDGRPDLYDVNYAKGDGIYEKVCEHDGVKGTCTPMAFEPEADVFFINNGDGTFSNQTAEHGFDEQGGNGLGAVAANLNNNQSCELFVANDADANFLFSQANESAEQRFSQTAQLAGVAVDGGGSAQACMGIAIADVDGNRRMDIFVTNYYQEHNVLYSQLAEGTFVDFSRNCGLYSASFSKLGFGTQFFDADLDSWPDLFVANGHVDDFRHTGAEYAMQPQYFSNVGMGVFSENSASSLGPYFEASHLGRGVASLDWNADGRPDVAVSHLDHPIGLLLNETSTANKFLKLSIHGLSKDRDAIGNIVSIQTNVRTITTQLTAGSGYMASNENVIMSGLGDQPEACNTEVTWRAVGSAQFLLQPDRHWAIVEGRALPYAIPQ